MGKFSFGKKKDDDDDDGNRNALFGSRSKNKSPAPASNPYAQQPPPMYSDPYTAAKARVGQAAPPPSDLKNPYGGMDRPGNGPGPKGGPGMNGGYAPGRPGAQGGYGGDRYGGGPAPGAGGGSRYGPGGYGGLGGSDPNDPNDDSRNALFGDARQRHQEREQSGLGQGQPPPYSTHEGGSGVPDGGPGSSYNPYQERQLTAEEEEEEDIQTTKQDIRFMKQQDVSSTRNALRVAAEAEESGRNTLARLGAQGERIHNTEAHLDLAANQNRIAEEKARELKKLNKSMFAVHVSNPFTGGARRQARDEAIMDRHQQERLQREETRLAAFRTEQRMEKSFRDIEKEGKGRQQGKKTLAERSKYQFEQDSEDEDMENQIDSNLDALHGAATRLNGLAKATGKELEEQNRRLDVIGGKSDVVDDQIHMNRARLNRIH